MKKFALLAACAVAFAACARDLYINADPAQASDSYNGLSPTFAGGTVGPKLTYQGLYEDADSKPKSGDIVHAAPGVYSNGCLTASSRRYRVILPAGVTLVADRGAAVTVIRGLADGDTTASPWGCGANAVSGVLLNGAETLVKDFTIDHCYAPGYGNDYWGGAVQGVSASQASSFAVGCTITNCVSGRGAGASNAVVIRCRFGQNRGGTGDDLIQCAAFNCLFGDANGYNVYQRGPFVNCTFFGSGVYNGNTLVTFGNCVIMKKPNSSTAQTLTNSTYNVSSSARATLNLTEDWHPLRSSALVDAGDGAYYESLFPSSAKVADQKNLDLDGNPRTFGASVDRGCFESQIPASAATWLVNGKTGSDAVTGLFPAEPFATIPAALTNVNLRAGDTVRLAPGVYTNGVMTASSVNCRAIVPAGVTLAGESAETTLIAGAPDPSVSLDASPYGCGEAAVSGVRLGKKAVVRNVTLTRCFTCSYTKNHQGAAVYGYYDSTSIDGGLRDTYVVGCIVTNNVSGRSAVSYSTLANCRLGSNRSANPASDAFSSRCYNCLFGDNESLCNVYQKGPCVNCTFAGTGASVNGNAAMTFVNCLVLKGSQNKDPTYENCLVDTSSKALENLRIGTDYVPLRRSKAIGAGDAARYAELVPEDIAADAATDLAGQPRTRDGALDTGCYEAPVYNEAWYVGGAGASDDNDGTAPDRAFATLKAAMEKADLLSNDVVRVAAGDYAGGETTVMTSDAARYRVIVPDFVSLVADGTREQTRIFGAEDRENGTEEDRYCGPQAVRCVYLGQGATLKGFTLTGGRAPAFNASSSVCYGGAVRAYDASAYVIDCLVTNNAAGRGAGLHYATAVGCVFADNSVKNTAVDIMTGRAFGCVFGDVESGFYNVYQGGPYVNCTFYGTGSSAHAASGSTITLYNSICLKGPASNVRLVDSITTKGGYALGSGAAKVADAQLDADLRPLAASPAVNAGVATNYQWLADGRVGLPATDASGSQRIYEGRIDLGALEHDARPEFARHLRRRHLAVDRAGADAVLTDSGLKVGAGAIAFTWEAGAGQLFVNLAVTGDGVAEVRANGELVRSCAASEGACRVAVPESKTDAVAVEVAYVPSGADDAGYALLGRCDRTGGFGTLLIVR